ncbi:MAG TPA: SMP-30/gluconolactonase/LRE family protein [Pirellulaceae bacterium]|nr:SMP-30/gluconolactonase/LRE family protein [Pirellulaceae bacterium]
MRYLWTLLIVLSCSLAHAQDMPLSQVLIDGEGWQLVSEGHQFTEGPTCDKDGNVYFVDVPKSQIFKINAADGKVALWAEDVGKISGLKFGADGRLYGAQGGKKAIVAIELKADGTPGQQTPLVEGVEPNDLVVTRENQVYFTDFSGKQVWFVDTKGNKRSVDTGIERPNGVILWPDQKTLVVADNAGPHLWTFRIEADGSLTHKAPYYTMRMVPGKRDSGGDGMTVDQAGRLYVASHAGLQVYDPTGRMSGVILKPQDKFLANVCFGGPKFDTLYVTCSDKVYKRQTKAAGVRYFE